MKFKVFTDKTAELKKKKLIFQAVLLEYSINKKGFSMAALSAIGSDSHSYFGSSEINFFQDELKGLHVTIDTNRLHIRSILPCRSDYRYCRIIFRNKKVMEKFATGNPESSDNLANRVNSYVRRWQQNNPYSCFVVFKKNTTDFLGLIILGSSNQEGAAELAYLFLQTHWRNGYAREAVTAIVQEYALATIQEGYALGGKPLERIIATSRPDNTASNRILEKVGMQIIRNELRYGRVRHLYQIEISKLDQKYNASLANDIFLWAVAI